MPRKKKHLTIGTTIKQTTVRRYAVYTLVERTWADGQGGSVTSRDYLSMSGVKIDQQHRRGRRPALLRTLLKLGIMPEPIDSNRDHCSVGRAPDGTWYGWSHRAIVGFKPGRDHAFDERRLKDDTPFQHSTDRLIKTERGARGSAVRFARSVS